MFLFNAKKKKNRTRGKRYKAMLKAKNKRRRASLQK